MPNVDLHIHSDNSDGSDTIPVLAEKILKAGLNIFALTDHDTTEGCTEILKYIPTDIKFIPGIELTCIADSIKCHILGYNCNINDEVLSALIEKGKKLRRIKLETRIKYLNEVWGINFSNSELDWLYSRKSVVKTHLANLLVKRGLSENNVSAMKKYLDGCKTGNTRFDGKEGINAIISSGGVPIWAHPLGGEGELHYTRAEFLPRLEIMKSFGIIGLECYYSRYSDSEINFLLKCAADNNLLISGGSDYHGTNKDIPLLKLNAEEKPVEASKLSLLNYI